MDRRDSLACYFNPLLDLSESCQAKLEGWILGVQGTRNTNPYDPEAFSAETAKFDDPRVRWRTAFLAP